MRTLQRRLVRVAAAAVAVVGWGAVIVAPTGASASLVTFTYQGTVDTVDPFLSLQFSIGETFTFTYTFEDTTADVNPNTALGEYTGAISTYTATTDFYTATGSTGRLQVWNSGNDQYLAQGLSPTAPPVGPFDLLWVAAQFVDTTGTVFSSDAIPAFQPGDTFMFASRRLLLEFTNPPDFSGGFTVIASVPFPLTPVPLPAALPLFGSALAMLGIVGWRRKRRAEA